MTIIGKALFPVTTKKDGKNVFGGICSFVVSLTPPSGANFIRIGHLLWTTPNLFADVNTVAGLLSAVNVAMGSWPASLYDPGVYPPIYTYVVDSTYESTGSVVTVPIHGASLGLAATIASMGFMPENYAFTGFEQSVAAATRKRGNLRIHRIDELKIKAAGVAALGNITLICPVESDAPPGVLQCRTLKDVLTILEKDGVKTFPTLHFNEAAPLRKRIRNEGSS